MRFIPTKAHAAVDYLTGILLIVVPLYFVGQAGAAAWVPILIGCLILGQSVLTDYELSLANLIPMRFHLLMDGLAGALLAVSPWLFGFSEIAWIPHVVVGLFEIGAAMTTELHRRGPLRYPNPPRGAAST